jgi:hypothetical protein
MHHDPFRDIDYGYECAACRASGLNGGNYGSRMQRQTVTEVQPMDGLTGFDWSLVFDDDEQGEYCQVYDCDNLAVVNTESGNGATIRTCRHHTETARLFLGIKIRTGQD